MLPSFILTSEYPLNRNAPPTQYTTVPFRPPSLPTYYLESSGFLLAGEMVIPWYTLNAPSVSRPMNLNCPVRYGYKTAVWPAPQLATCSTSVTFPITAPPKT